MIVFPMLYIVKRVDEDPTTISAVVAFILSLFIYYFYSLIEIKFYQQKIEFFSFNSHKTEMSLALLWQFFVTFSIKIHKIYPTMVFSDKKGLEALARLLNG